MIWERLELPRWALVTLVATLGTGVTGTVILSAVASNGAWDEVRALPSQPSPATESGATDDLEKRIAALAPRGRYVVVTGSEYDEHYLQVIRAAGGADVELTQTAAMSTQIVTGWQDIGSYEVATVLLPAEGPYEVHSLGANSFFGVLQYGYSNYNGAADNSSGYGYMGGMKAEQIFIP